MISSTQSNTEHMNDDTTSSQNVIIPTLTGVTEIDIPHMSAPAPLLRTTAQPADLAGFLARPVRIDAREWSDHLGFTLRPWALFLNDPGVQSKLFGFGLLRGTLHLTVVCNGSPFHYGRVLAAYKPTVGLDVYTDTELSQDSQLPHMLINPCGSSTQKMVLPFTYDRYFISLSGTDASIGVLNVRHIIPLEMANVATPEPVTITFFAHMEDVELTLPSPYPIGTFVTKRTVTKTGKDEYGVGPVSRVASAVSAAAGALATVPVIAPFATATQIGAQAVGSIAALFGFARPTIISDPGWMKPAFTSPLSITSGGDLSRKLTLDPKSELTVDSRTIALDGEDHMNFDYIKRIPMLLAPVTWTTSQNPNDVLATIPVSPSHRTIGVTAGVNDYSIYTPSGHIAQCFEQWTGTIDIHLQVVCSEYHRGRLKIAWVPVSGTYDASVYNLALTEIIDIRDRQDYTISVGWGQTMPYANTGAVQVGNFGAPYDELCNGYLIVSVVNELTVPLSTQDASILIWACAGKDVEFQNPKGPPTASFTDFENSSGRIKADDDEGCCDYTVSFFESEPRDGVALVHYGERINSVRSLIKRSYLWGYGFNWNSASLPSTQARGVEWGYRIPHFPFPSGAASSVDVAFHSSTPAFTPWNFVNMTHLAWFFECYLGYRGAVRWKVDNKELSLVSDTGATQATYTTPKIEHRIYRQSMGNADAQAGYFARFETAVPTSAQRMYSKSESMKGRAGQEIFGVPTNEMFVTEVESPDYNPLLYHTGYKVEREGERLDSLVEYFYSPLNTGGATAATTSLGYTGTSPIYVSAGEDLTFFFFRHTPKVIDYPAFLAPEVYFPADNITTA